MAFKGSFRVTPLQAERWVQFPNTIDNHPHFLQVFPYFILDIERSFLSLHIHFIYGFISWLMQRILHLFLLASLCTSLTAQIADAPLFRDPVTDGAADPCIIYNRQENSWWMLYTQRRANCEAPDVAYCYATQIGVACSEDHGRSWYYRGTLDLNFEPGTHTFWAPDVVYADSVYHLFVVFIRGARIHWGGKATLMHYTSPDLWHWTLQGPLSLPQENVIDPTLLRMPDGTWRMWYKYKSRSYCADSPDLYTWTGNSEAAVTDSSQEGAKAFLFKGRYWLIADEWQGMAVYSSDDATHWQRQQERILTTASSRPDDGPSGAHGDVVVIGDEAYIFYFTHPERTKHTDTTMDSRGIIPFGQRRSSIQVARLNVDGDQLIVEDRNQGVAINLQP